MSCVVLWHGIFLFLFWLISRTEGAVWRGWMTNPLCSFRIVWRQGAGHSWRTQGGDGSLGSKVPGGLAGGTWPYYYSNINSTTNCCRHLEGVLGFSLLAISLRYFVIIPFFVISITIFFLGSLSYTVLCLQAVAFLLIFSFFQLVLFQVLATSPAGGGTTDCFS